MDKSLPQHEQQLVADFQSFVVCMGKDHESSVIYW